MPPFMVATDWVFVGVFLFALAKSKTQQERALALFVGVSVLVHQVEEVFRPLGINNWFVDHAYPVPMAILCAYALGAKTREVASIGALLTVGALANIAHGSVTTPETVIHAMSAAWITCKAVDGKDDLLGLSMLAYWGLSLPVIILLPLAFAPPWSTLSMLLQVIRAFQVVGLIGLVVWYVRR